MSDFRRVLNGVPYIQQRALWEAVAEAPIVDRSRTLMRLSGVTFWDKDSGRFVKRPAVGIVGIGGLGFQWNERMPRDTIELSAAAGRSITQTEITDSVDEMMGFGGFYSYMNSGNHAPTKLFKKMVDAGHASTAHLVTLNILIAGVSTAVENEFNSQRDLAHFCRLTEARAEAQSKPPIVVLDPATLDYYQSIVTYTEEKLREHDENSAEHGRKRGLEPRNMAFPAAKATAFIMSASLRDFQKIVGAITDEGKEDEYRNLLSLLTDALARFSPLLFQASSSYGYRCPDHYQEDEG